MLTKIKSIRRIPIYYYLALGLLLFGYLINPTIAATKSIALNIGDKSVYSDAAGAPNGNSAYYTGESVKGTCSFGLYACSQINGSFKLASNATYKGIKAGNKVTSRTISGYRYYKVRIVAGGDLIPDIQCNELGRARVYAD